MAERRFPRDFKALESIYAFIREFVADCGIDPEVAFDLDVNAEELFTDMVKYGHGGTRNIAIDLDWAAPTITMRLRDFDVDRFDPTAVPPVNTNRPIEERHAGGLGIHLVRQIADHFEYAYENRNSTITITKRLSA